jgi:hypothetical protein
MEVLKTPTLLWGAAAAPLPGQTESGDRLLVEIFEEGALVAVVDALGHGRRAAQIAVRTVDILRQHARGDVVSLIERCHAALRERDGAAMSLASFDWRSHRMSWLGIGNVAGVLVPSGFLVEAPARHLLVRSGVVGGDLPLMEPSVLAFAPGDTLIMATDGIQERFADDLPSGLEPQPLAEHIFAHHGKSTDDALVLVARYQVRLDERDR